jgi:E3 ubiquitin-protein ligase HUWE1
LVLVCAHLSLTLSRQFVKSVDHATLEKLLKFSTGSTRVPAGGFSNLRYPFRISWNGFEEADTQRLMTGHSCFSWIKLPEYSSYDVLVSQVGLAIEHGDSFEFA